MGGVLLYSCILPLAFLSTHYLCWSPRAPTSGCHTSRKPEAPSLKE